MSDLLKRAMEQANDYDFDNVSPSVCKWCCHTHVPEWTCIPEGLKRHVAYRLDKERGLTTRLAAAEAALEEIADFDEVEDVEGDLEHVAVQCIAIAKIAMFGKSGGGK